MIRGCLQLLLAGVIALAAVPTVTLAHEMSIAEMEVRELGPGEFIWTWTATNQDSGASLTPVWPQPCKVDQNLLHCGSDGIHGPLAMQGVGQRYSAAIVKVNWRDGTMRAYTLTAAQPEVQVYGAADSRRGTVDVATAYFVLGVEHILTGFDHLMFVLGLLFLVGFRRRLVATITAFTAAHSLTLALSALGVLTLRPPPVEATIALSIVLVCGEALHQRATLARRWPAVVAFLFGLVHGLGFAGALREIGLPQQHLSVALLTFNLGVECGQLLVVGAAGALWMMGRRSARLVALRTPMLYGMGSVAAYWSWIRIAAMFA